MTSNDWGAAVIGAALATIVTIPLAPAFWAVFITYFMVCFVMMLRTHLREVDEARLEHELHRQRRLGEFPSERNPRGAGHTPAREYLP